MQMVPAAKVQIFGTTESVAHVEAGRGTWRAARSAHPVRVLDSHASGPRASIADRLIGEVIGGAVTANWVSRLACG
jgi:hypothetical protein